MTIARSFCWVILLIYCLSFVETAQARKRRKRYRPRRPHPVVLWSRTLSKSDDLEQRKVAAFKLSQYSLRIFQNEVINTLIQCTKDPETHIKVLCTKALGNARKRGKNLQIRRTLFERYQSDPILRNTIVRTFINRKDDHANTRKQLLDFAKKSKDSQHLVVLLKYFEKYGSGSDEMVKTLTEIYRKHSVIKVKSGVAKALIERAQGQDSVVALLAECSQSNDTPLQLTCLSGLESQAKDEPRAWDALQVSLDSADPDVLLSALDALITFSEKPNVAISNRLIGTIADMDDSDIREKAILGIGVTGDRSQVIVNTLINILAEETDEGLRIAAALVLGKQAANFPKKAMELYALCLKEEKFQSLKTACQLGQQQLKKSSALAARNQKNERSPTTKPKKN